MFMCERVNGPSTSVQFVCFSVTVCGIQLQYRLSAVSSNVNAIRELSFSVAKSGRIPTRLTGKHTS